MFYDRALKKLRSGGAQRRKARFARRFSNVLVWKSPSAEEDTVLS
jgi:hypothetical protein